MQTSDKNFNYGAFDIKLDPLLEDFNSVRFVQKPESVSFCIFMFLSRK